MARIKTSCLRAVLLLIACFLVVPGCAMLGGGSGNEEGKKSEKIGEMEKQKLYSIKNLKDDLLTYASNFEAYVRAASNKIRSRTDSKRIKKRTLLWKLRIVPMVHEIASRTEPQVDYLALAYLTRTMKLYLKTGDGKEVFGEQQPIAVKAAAELDQMVRDIGQEFMNPEQMGKLEDNVQIYAEKNPIRGPNFSLEMTRKSIQKIDQANEFSWITDISLAPVGAMSAISAMPSATRDLSRTVWVTSHIVKHLPRLLRWQFELLLYELENRDFVKDVVKAVNNIDETSRKTGERLEKSGKSLINYALIRLAGLLVLAFVLVLAYRIIMYLFLTPSGSEQES